MISRTPSTPAARGRSHCRRWERGRHDAAGRRPLPLVIAHRGASAHAPENSLASFERARRDGADAVELDVVRCRTGEVVVFHDQDLERIAGDRRRIAALSLRELRAVRLPSGAAIPTLEEALACLAGMLVNIELKAEPDAEGLVLAATVAADLARRGDGANLLVSSFNPFALAAFRALAPHLATGLLFFGEQSPALRGAWARHALRPTALHPHHALASRSTIDAWHAAGLLVNCWTVNDPAEQRRLVAAGVDGIITDDPAAARAVIEAAR